MNKRFFCSTMMAAAVIALSTASVSTAGFPFPPAPPGVNVQINGYLPSPPGVSIQMDAGRPYYVERERRIYVERDPKYRKHKHKKEKHRKEYRDHDDHGRGHDNGKHKGRD